MNTIRLIILMAVLNHMKGLRIIVENVLYIHMVKQSQVQHEWYLSPCSSMNKFIMRAPSTNKDLDISFFFCFCLFFFFFFGANGSLMCWNQLSPLSFLAVMGHQVFSFQCVCLALLLKQTNLIAILVCFPLLSLYSFSFIAVQEVKAHDLEEYYYEIIAKWFKVKCVFRDKKLFLKPSQLYATFIALGLTLLVCKVLVIKLENPT